MMTTDRLKLKRLVDKKQINELLASFMAAVPVLKLAVADESGNVIAQSPNWSDESLGSDARLYNLTAGKKEVGALLVQGPEVKASEELLQQSLQLIVNQGVDKRALTAEALERYRELTLMYRLSESIGSSYDADRLPELVLEESSRLIQADTGMVLLATKRSDGKTGLDLRVSYGTEGYVEPLKEIISVLLQKSWQTGRSAVYTDELPNSAYKAVLWAPFKRPNRVLGGVLLGRLPAGLGTFSAGEEKLLTALTEQTAVAIDNGRLVDDLRHTNSALEKANRQLQELDKLKSDFIGVVTHELRTPLANIVFPLEIMDRHGRKHLPDDISEELDKVVDGIKTARTMVDNLVNYATFISKQGEINPLSIDFSAAVHESLTPLQLLAKNKGLEMTIETEGDPRPVLVSKDRLSDAVHHLVHNAIKFTERGGKVDITISYHEDAVHFQVQDTGVGIPPEQLPDLWEGFNQMADPLKRGAEGLGLGLALVNYVANAHGGEVWAESEVGVGSTFGFKIPYG